MTKIPSYFVFYLATAAALEVHFRKATPDDVSFARKTMFQEAMNPLSIAKEHLLVASFSENKPDDPVAFGQIRPVNADYCELASLYVLPEFRKQNIGHALVGELLRQFEDDKARNKQRKICLLTLRPTMKFYEQHGFREATDITTLPASIRFEHAAGTVLSSILGNDLACMVRDCPTQL
jgi:ribosomal protein S18 acetylase RimI-like enzyme